MMTDGNTFDVDVGLDLNEFEDIGLGVYVYALCNITFNIVTIGVCFSGNDHREFSEVVDAKTNTTAELVAVKKAILAVNSKQCVVVHIPTEHLVSALNKSSNPIENADLLEEIHDIVNKREGLTYFRVAKDGSSGINKAIFLARQKMYEN